MDYLVGPLPMGPQTAIRPLKEICHREDNPFHDRSLGDIEELPLFLSREVGPIAHAMEVSMHSCVLSLLISLSPHRNFWALLSPRLASLSLSATTNHSDVFGWRGNAITQDCLFYQSTISMFREKVQINGDPQSRLFISYISSMHINRVLWPSIPACPILLEAFTTPRSPSRPIPTLIILCLKGDVNYMVVTLTIFLDLDLFFYSLNGDTELIERDNDILDVSWLQRRYGIEFMGYQVSWWSSRLWGSHII